MPLELLGGHFGVFPKPVHYALHAPRKRGAGICHAEPESVARPYLYGYFAISREPHEFAGKGHYKAVKIGAGYIFEMTARHNALGKSVFHYGKIFFHGLRAS